MDILFALFSIIFLCLTDSGQAKEKVEFIKKSRSLMVGEYINKAGRGIKFYTKDNGRMYISTLENRVIIDNQSPATSTDHILEIEGSTFIRKSGSNEDYYIYPHEAHIIKSTKLYFLKQLYVQEILQNARQTDGKYHKKAIGNAITLLMNDPHHKAIIEAAHYIGKREKLTGRKYPSLLPLYLFAMKLEEISLGGGALESMSNKTEGFHYKCLTNCPPCTSNHCIGMCGMKCMCWKFVCGDCCYHHACFQHDVACRVCGYLSSECIVGSFNVIANCSNKGKTPVYRNKC
jgi:hypothetical protein